MCVQKTHLRQTRCISQLQFPFLSLSAKVVYMYKIIKTTTTISLTRITEK